MQVYVFLTAGIPSFKCFLVLVHLVRVHTFFFSSLWTKGACDSLQVVFSLFVLLWAFLTFQYIWFLFANYNIAQCYTTTKCHLHLPNKDLYYIIPSATFSVMYWLQPDLDVYRLSYIKCLYTDMHSIKIIMMTVFTYLRYHMLNSISFVSFWFTPEWFPIALPLFLFPLSSCPLTEEASTATFIWAIKSHIRKL